MNIGVVAALPREAATLRPGRMADGGRLRVMAAGLGRENAARAAQALCTEKVDVLVSWGVVGALSDTLSPGTLVVVDAIRTQGETMPVDVAWKQWLVAALNVRGLGFVSGDVYCSDHAVGSTVGKQKLAAYGGLIVDMESAGVAQVARQAQIPFVAIKSVCDPLQRTLPPAIVRLQTTDGRLRWSALPAVLVRGPAMWQSLFRLRADFTAACASLERAAQALFAS